MALDTGIAQYEAPEKDLYEMGEMPPMGLFPKQCMRGPFAANVMANRITRMHGRSRGCPSLDSHEVLVLVMAAGVNYNGVWARLGSRSARLMAQAAATISLALTPAGIVWAVGEKVKRGKSGTKW